MKKIKKLLAVFLMSVMSISAFAEYAVVDGIRYFFNDYASEAVVLFYIGNPYSGDIIIPETVDYNGKTYSVTRIEQDAFDHCTGLTSVVIPNSVTSIGKWAFYYCTGLKSVNIPNSVRSIDIAAFYGCSALMSVTIGSNLTSIGESAFSNCSALETIIVDNDNSVYDSRDNCNAIIETETNTLITGCKNTVIPNSVTTIGENSFENCKNLTSIIIPNSVTTIKSQAFYDCSGLTSVTIPNSVISIGYSAFTACSALTSVTIPNSVVIIGDNVFADCSGLTLVTIGSSVKSIGNQTFYDCKSLTSVISMIEEPFGITDTVFEVYYPDTSYSEFTSATLYIPAGTNEKYLAAEGWKNFKEIIELTPARIENAEVQLNDDAPIYNINGQRVDKNYKGFVIQNGRKYKTK